MVWYVAESRVDDLCGLIYRLAQKGYLREKHAYACNLAGASNNTQYAEFYSTYVLDSTSPGIEAQISFYGIQCERATGTIRKVHLIGNDADAAALVGCLTDEDCTD